MTRTRSRRETEFLLMELASESDECGSKVFGLGFSNPGHLLQILIEHKGHFAAGYNII